MDPRIEELTDRMAGLKRTVASQARFRTLIDQADEAIFVIDPETDRFVDANETALRWLALSRQDLLSRTTSEVHVEFPLGYPESEKEVTRDARDLRRSWVCSRVHRRRDGTCFPVEVAVSQRRFADHTYTLVVARESRQHRKAEQVLRESQELHRAERDEMEARIEKLSSEMSSLRRTLGSLARFRTIIDQADEAIFVIDPDTERFVDANETALRWVGLSRLQLLSSRIQDLDVEFPLACPDDEEDAAADARGLKRPWVCGRVHRRRDGSYFPVEVAVAKRQFANRIYTLVVARESKQNGHADQVIREVEERYSTLFGHTTDAVYLTGREGRIADVNEATLDLLGYSREEMIDVKARNFYAEAPDTRLFSENVNENGFVRDLPVQLSAKDGSVIAGLLTAIPRRTGNGTIGGYQCLIRRRSEPGAEPTPEEPESVEVERPDGDATAAAAVGQAAEVAAETDELVESWAQYEQMRPAIDAGEPSLAELFGTDQPESDSMQEEPEEPRIVSDVTEEIALSAEQLSGITQSDAEAAPTEAADTWMPSDVTQKLTPPAAEQILAVEDGPPDQPARSPIDPKALFTDPDTEVVAETSPPATTPAATEIASPAAEATPPATEAAPPAVEATAPAAEAVPPAVEATPPATEVEPPTADTAPPAADVTPAAAEAAPPAAEIEAPDPGATPPAAEVESSAAGVAPSAGVAEPAVEFVAPATEDTHRLKPELSDVTPLSYRPDRRLDRAQPRNGAGTREALRRRTPLPRQDALNGDLKLWPLMLALGAAVTVFAWTDLVRLTYVYNAGFDEWQLAVRILGLALVSIGVLGRFWRRTGLAIGVGVLTLGVVLLGTYVEYLRHFPFELKDVVPDTSAAVDSAILRVSGFTLAAVLFCGLVCWNLWAVLWPRDDESHP
jgi:PAS domain S-box-containing protein